MEEPMRSKAGKNTKKCIFCIFTQSCYPNTLEKLGIFHKTHFQQEAASSGSSEGNGKTISKSSQLNFCIFDEIVTMSEKVNLNMLYCYLKYFLDFIHLF